MISFLKCSLGCCVTSRQGTGWKQADELGSYGDNPGERWCVLDKGARGGSPEKQQTFQMF